MTDLIYSWLRGYPGLELLQRQQVDAVPGGAGLFFRGVTVKERSHDLLGSLRCRKTLSFRLCRYDIPVENLIFFLMLTAWVETNGSALGQEATAALKSTGSVISDATAALKNTRCVRDNGQGLTLWEGDLEITYTEEAV